MLGFKGLRELHPYLCCWGLLMPKIRRRGIFTASLVFLTGCVVGSETSSTNSLLSKVTVSLETLNLQSDSVRVRAVVRNTSKQPQCLLPLSSSIKVLNLAQPNNEIVGSILLKDEDQVPTDLPDSTYLGPSGFVQFELLPSFETRVVTQTIRFSDYSQEFASGSYSKIGGGNEPVFVAQAIIIAVQCDKLESGLRAKSEVYFGQSFATKAIYSNLSTAFRPNL